MSKIKSPKKLIEVALPLDDINAASAKEKSIRHGHPSTLHLWWARRPLAAARAVIFAQMVNDPSETVTGDKRLRETKLKIQNEREKLFDIIRELVKWENTNNEEVLNRAHEAIKESWKVTCELNKRHPQADELFNPNELPAFHDPFAGGGAIPLEAKRLGMDSFASDLNPLPLTINKALIELPTDFLGHQPIASDTYDSAQKALGECQGLEGLAVDIKRYGRMLREKAFEKLEKFYPQLEVTEEIANTIPGLQSAVGKKLKPNAYLYARAAKSPNPAFNSSFTPLCSSFQLSTKKGQEAYLAPIISETGISFEVKYGLDEKFKHASSGTKAGRGANFRCLFSDTPISADYVKAQGAAGKIINIPTCIVVTWNRRRYFVGTDLLSEKFLQNPISPIELSSLDIQSMPLADHSQYMGTLSYGLTKIEQLYTDRQLFALSTISELIKEVSEAAYRDYLREVRSNNKADQFKKVVAVYLTLALSKLSDSQNSLVTWKPSMVQAIHVFTKQAIPMVWDFAEPNLFGEGMGDYNVTLDNMMRVIPKLPENNAGFVVQADAAKQDISFNKVISTDPPYYDNVPYADLSDFFYFWLRKPLKSVLPEFYSTISIPKTDELVADRKRHGSKNDAERFFLEGMTNAMSQIARLANPAFPTTIYYAFKQSEKSEKGSASTGWETFLEAVISSGLEIVGTWPMRTELANRMRGLDSNALASSIVMVCVKREPNAESTSRRQFQRELREHMPQALEDMIGGTLGASPIAPVDLAQSAIGPGMAIYSKYEAVLNQDGSKMSVHDALVLINRAITECLNPDSGNFDNDTLFCDDWFSQYGWSQGQFGEADTLARAKGTSVDGVRDAGVIESGGGKVRLLKWSEYPTHWDPKADTRIPVWEACHQMIRVLNQQGEAEAGSLLARMPELGEHIRQLAYHLYTLCERKKWAEEARAYNELIGSWHAIVAASHEVGHRGTQSELGLDF
jgi:putative DNA methylase